MWTLWVTSALAVTGSVAGAGAAGGATDPGACHVIGHAAAYLPTGRVEDTTVVVDGGRIVAVGALPTVTASSATWAGRACDYVDGHGKVLTPGLVETATHLGLVEIDQEPQTDDFSVGADPGVAVSSAVRVSDAYNPRSVSIPVTRMEGVTEAVVSPSGGLVSGQSAWVQLAGGTQAEAVVEGDVAVHASFGVAPSRAEDLRNLRDLLALARRWPSVRATWQPGMLPQGIEPTDLDMLAPVLDRRVPLIIGADRASDIEALIRFAGEEKIRLVLEGGAEGWLLADALAKAQIGVIVNPYVYGAGGFDDLQGRPDNAALLQKAGVLVMVSSFSTQNARTLRQVAGNAVRDGLDHDAAIRALTETPAVVFGRADRGRIATGMAADLVLWSGDPLELSTTVDAEWIGGRRIELVSRQTDLLKKYRTLR